MLVRERDGCLGLWVNGDWHTELTCVLARAKDDIKSPEIQAAIVNLQGLLEKKDECVHTVTVRITAPAGIDPFSIVSCLKKAPWLPDSVDLEDGEIIAVTITHRGSWNYVHHVAERCIKETMREVIWSARKADILSLSTHLGGLPPRFLP